MGAQCTSERSRDCLSGDWLKRSTPAAENGQVVDGPLKTPSDSHPKETHTIQTYSHHPVKPATTNTESKLTVTNSDALAFELVSLNNVVEGQPPQVIDMVEEKKKDEARQKAEEEGHAAVEDLDSIQVVMFPGIPIQSSTTFKVRTPIKGLYQKTTYQLLAEEGEAHIDPVIQPFGDFEPRDEPYVQTHETTTLGPEDLACRYHVVVEFRDGSDVLLDSYGFILAGPITLENIETQREGAPVKNRSPDFILPLKERSKVTTIYRYTVNQDLPQLDLHDEMFQPVQGQLQLVDESTTKLTDREHKARAEPYEVRLESTIPSGFGVRGLYTGVTSFRDERNRPLVKFQYKFQIKKSYTQADLDA